MYPNKCFLGRYNHWRTALSRQKEMDTPVKELIVKRVKIGAEKQWLWGHFISFVQSTPP